MTIYTTCPMHPAAKRAWLHFKRKNAETPKAMWKLPNNFGRGKDIELGGWSNWIADYGDWKDYWDPTQPDRSEVRNVFDFIKEQTLIDRLIRRKK